MLAHHFLFPVLTYFTTFFEQEDFLTIQFHNYVDLLIKKILTHPELMHKLFF